MIRKLILAVCLLLVVVGATGPTASLVYPAHAAPAAQHANLFDKTRVVVHLAIAYGVFHHWVYKPFKAGDLNVSHKVNLVKAGLALLFAVHEIKKALAITSQSNSGTLKALNTVLVGLQTKFTNIGNLFHQAPSGITDTQVASSVNDLNSNVDASNKLVNAPDAPMSLLGKFR